MVIMQEKPIKKILRYFLFVLKKNEDITSKGKFYKSRKIAENAAKIY